MGVKLAGIVTGETNHGVAGEGPLSTTLVHAPKESRGWTALADHDVVWTADGKRIISTRTGRRPVHPRPRRRRYRDSPVSAATDCVHAVSMSAVQAGPRMSLKVAITVQ